MLITARSLCVLIPVGRQRQIRLFFFSEFGFNKFQYQTARDRATELMQHTHTHTILFCINGGTYTLHHES
jgi:hypothetical protein